MTLRAKGMAVLVVQVTLVLSIAAKYAWERHACPRVWTRAVQYDPERVIRGRYLALTLRATACGLPRGEDAREFGLNAKGEWGELRSHQQKWNVVPAARDGKLAPAIAVKQRPEETQELTLSSGHPCEAAVLSGQVEFFIAEHAKAPFPLAKGDELWAEVTVPPSGPPRPLRLAVSNGRNFRVLDLH